MVMVLVLDLMVGTLRADNAGAATPEWWRWQWCHADGGDDGVGAMV